MTPSSEEIYQAIQRGMAMAGALREGDNPEQYILNQVLELITPLEEGKPSEKPDFIEIATKAYHNHGCRTQADYVEHGYEFGKKETITSLQSEVEKHKRKAIAYRKEGDVIIANLTAEVDRLKGDQVRLFNKWNDDLYKGYYISKIDLETMLESFEDWYQKNAKLAVQEPVKSAEDVLKSYVKRVGYPDMNVADAITAMEEYANQFKPKKA